MNNLGVLIKYEWKKLWQKKMVKISLAAALLLQIFSCVFSLTMTHRSTFIDENGNEIVEYEMSGYEMLMEDKKNAMVHNGRVVDDAFIREAVHASAENVEEYKAIYTLLRDVFGDNTENADAEALYQAWKSNIVEEAKWDFHLSSKEVSYWSNKVGKVKTPFTYKAALFWEEILQIGATIGAIVMILVASCLSGVFADESRSGTDQLILCSQNGKIPVYTAKMITGTLFGTGCLILLYIITFAIRGGIQGIEGFSADIQPIISNSPYALSIGQMFLIVFGTALLVSALHSLFTMLLSEYLKNAVASMLIMVVIMLLSIALDVPDYWRVIAQIHSYMPLNSVAVWNLVDFRTVPVFGARLNYYQVTTVLYLLLSAGIIFIGKAKYRSKPVRK